MNRKTNIKKDNNATEFFYDHEITLISFDPENDDFIYPVFCGKFYIIIQNKIIVDAETNIVVRPIPEEVMPIFYSRR